MSVTSLSFAPRTEDERGRSLMAAFREDANWFFLHTDPRDTSDELSLLEERLLSIKMLFNALLNTVHFNLLDFYKISL